MTVITETPRKRNKTKARVRRKEWFYRAQEGLCCHCGEPMVLHGSGARRATFEHLTPRPGDKRRTMNDNTLLAHAICNERRGQKPVSDSLHERARRLWSEWRVMHGETS